MRKQLLACIVCVLWFSDSFADCWTDVSARYNIPVQLLRCIVETESSGNPKAIGQNATSIDIGFAQINEWWLPKIKQFGIEPDDLFNACTNLHVGAWILANNFKQYGYTWRAVGIYNAGTAKDSATERRRVAYANKIFTCVERDT